MNFRVYIIIETPILDKKYELLVPIDRRIHELINLLRKNIPELSENYYKENTPFTRLLSPKKGHNFPLPLKGKIRSLYHTTEFRKTQIFFRCIFRPKIAFKRTKTH